MIIIGKRFNNPDSDTRFIQEIMLSLYIFRVLRELPICFQI